MGKGISLSVFVDRSTHLSSTEMLTVSPVLLLSVGSDSKGERQSVELQSMGRNGRERCGGGGKS